MFEDIPGITENVEIVGDVGMLDGAAGFIRLHKTKSGKARRLPITAEMQEILDAALPDQTNVVYFSGSTPDRHVFLSAKGQPITSFRSAWDRTAATYVKETQ